MGKREINELVTPELVFSNWLPKLSQVFEQCNSQAMANLFTEDGHWRDILSFTWEHRTFSGSQEIQSAFAQATHRIKAHQFRLAAGRTAPTRGRRMGREVIEGYFDFDTDIGHGTGFARLLHDEA